MRNNFLLSALLVICLFCGGTEIKAQLPPVNAPLVKSTNSVFAVGEPKVIGSVYNTRNFSWRRDGGAVAFFGRVPKSTLKQERAALLEGKKLESNEGPALYVYDVINERLRLVGKLNHECDGDFFTDLKWSGQNLCTITMQLTTPKFVYRLYLYNSATDKMMLLDESVDSPVLDESPVGAPFLIERHKIGEEQHVNVIFDGRFFPVPHSTEGYNGGTYGWSRDGKRYLRQCQTREGDAETAYLISAETGSLVIGKTVFDREKDLYRYTFENFPLLSVFHRTIPNVLDQHCLAGKQPEEVAGGKSDSKAPLSPNEAPSVLFDQYPLALAEDGENSLSPDYSGVVYETQKTLFFRPIVEIRGNRLNQLNLRLEQEEVKRIGLTMISAQFAYLLPQPGQSVSPDTLTPENCREKLTPYITDKEAIRRFRWVCKGDLIGEVRSKHFRFVIKFNFQTTEEKLP